MDLWCVYVKNANPSLFLPRRNSFPEKPVISWNLEKSGYLRGGEDGRVFEIRFAKRKDLSSGYQHGSLVVRATGKKNHENSSSSGNGDWSDPAGDGIKRNNHSDDSNKSKDSPSEKPHRSTLDWREVRAALYAREQAEKLDGEPHKQGGTTPYEPRPLGTKWAHPISVPETGCVLVATEKLDGVRTFERTVVLLLRSGTRHPQEGPFGIVINRPLHKKIKHMKPTNLDLATTFADCSLHFGGPLEASMFLLKKMENSNSNSNSKSNLKSQAAGFEEVIPGMCFGARNSLDDAAEMVKKGLVKPQDFRFFVGYAGWQLDQLREEIESDYWHVAACSSNLICGASTEASESLWEEILQLMGGQYSELSRKPKQDM